MKISTEIGSAALRIGEERAVEYVAKAGFDAWDFTMCDNMVRYDWGTGSVSICDHPLSGSGYLAFARRIRQVGLDNGIVCNQSHAPFPSGVMGDYLKRVIECTAEAGGKICVVHPDNNKTPEENAQMYWKLLPFAKEHGVKIAAENVWSWDSEKDEACFAACATPDSFCAHLNVVNDPAFAACLDIGHAEMRGLGTSAVEMIHALGDRLLTLHIHDNDQWHDSHQIPFSMKIDFEAVLLALKEIGYHGYFTLESNLFLNTYADEDIFTGMKQLAISARRLADMYENIRKTG